MKIRTDKCSNFLFRLGLGVYLDTIETCYIYNYNSGDFEKPEFM